METESNIIFANIIDTETRQIYRCLIIPIYYSVGKLKQYNINRLKALKILPGTYELFS